MLSNIHDIHWYQVTHTHSLIRSLAYAMHCDLFLLGSSKNHCWQWRNTHIFHPYSYEGRMKSIVCCYRTIWRIKIMPSFVGSFYAFLCILRSSVSPFSVHFLCVVTSACPCPLCFDSCVRLHILQSCWTVLLVSFSLVEKFSQFETMNAFIPASFHNNVLIAQVPGCSLLPLLSSSTSSWWMFLLLLWLSLLLQAKYTLHKTKYSINISMRCCHVHASVCASVAAAVVVASLHFNLQTKSFIVASSQAHIHMSHMGLVCVGAGVLCCRCFYAAVRLFYRFIKMF